MSRGRQSFDQSGLGTDLPGEVEKDDDAFETYRKRMMLAYRFRPNPLVRSNDESCIRPTMSFTEQSKKTILLMVDGSQSVCVACCVY